MARNIFLLFLGIFGMVTGTIISVIDIVDFFVYPPPEGNYPRCNDTTPVNLTMQSFWTTSLHLDQYILDRSHINYEQSVDLHILHKRKDHGISNTTTKTWSIVKH